MALLAFIMAISLRDIFYALLCFVVGFIMISLSLYILSAPMLAAVQAIVYAGAIMVLFAFSVMLWAPSSRKNMISSREMVLALLVTVTLSFELCHTIIKNIHRYQENSPSIAEIAQAVFNEHGLLFELSSFVLLGALFASVITVKTILHKERSFRDSKP